MTEANVPLPTPEEIAALLAQLEQLPAEERARLQALPSVQTFRMAQATAVAARDSAAVQAKLDEVRAFIDRALPSH